MFHKGKLHLDGKHGLGPLGSELHSGCPGLNQLRRLIDPGRPFC